MIADISAEFARSCLDYDQETGVFLWRHRLDKADHWNRRYSGKKAGCVAKGGYLLIAINDRLMKAHRLAWLIVTGEWPKGVIDHINGEPADNRFSNLRDISQAENMRNQRRNSKNKSGFKGVSYFARDKKWLATIKVNRKTRYLGYFETPELAHAAYCAASLDLHGDYGRLN